MNEFPHAHKIIQSVDDIDSLPQPNPKTDGLLPFVLNRLKLAQPKIEAAGHKIRFAVARGPSEYCQLSDGLDGISNYDDDAARKST